MKKASLFLSLILFGYIAYGQNSNSTKFENQLNTSLEHYENNAIQDTLLRENIAKAFSYVIFSNSELATNASAFGYSQNKEKTTISINSNIRLGNTESPYYLRVGANASGSKNVFEFYDDDSWHNNVGINIGLIRRIFNPSVFYTGKKEIKELTDDRREIYAREIIYNEIKYNNENLENISELKKEIQSIDSKKDLLKNKDYTNILEILPDIKKLLTEKKYEEAYVSLDKEEKKIRKFLTSVDCAEKLKKYIENDLFYNFDKENDITYGYSLTWLDLNLKFSNSTYKLNEHNIDDDIIQDFSNLSDLTDDINKLKSVISFSFHKTHNAKKTIWYYQLGVNGTFGSFLNSSLVNGTPSIFQNDNNIFVIKDEENRAFGLYENIDKTLATGGFNVYGAIFFTENKNFGFNLSAQHEYLIRKPENTYYKNNFSFLLGPIFRKVKDGETSLTFGIDVGWENAIYRTRSEEHTSELQSHS